MLISLYFWAYDCLFEICWPVTSDLFSPSSFSFPSCLFYSFFLHLLFFFILFTSGSTFLFLNTLVIFTWCIAVFGCSQVFLVVCYYDICVQYYTHLVYIYHSTRCICVYSFSVKPYLLCYISFWKFRIKSYWEKKNKTGTIAHSNQPRLFLLAAGRALFSAVSCTHLFMIQPLPHILYLYPE